MLMRNRFGLALFGLVFLAFWAGAATAQDWKSGSRGSMLVESTGVGCMGREHSRAEAEGLALAEAKRIAVEQCRTHVKSETDVQDGELARDIISAYGEAEVRLLGEPEHTWGQVEEGDYSDLCCTTHIRAEVVPVERPAAPAINRVDNPRGPLALELWTDRETYSSGEMLTFSFKANKPCYVVALYQDSEGNLVMASQRARDKRYDGGTVYQLPAPGDGYSLMIVPPFGEDTLRIFASTRPLELPVGRLMSGMYVLDSPSRSIGSDLRGLVVVSEQADAGGAAEFAEAEVRIQVRQ